MFHVKHPFPCKKSDHFSKKAVHALRFSQLFYIILCNGWQIHRLCVLFHVKHSIFRKKAAHLSRKQNIFRKSREFLTKSRTSLQKAEHFSQKTEHLSQKVPKSRENVGFYAYISLFHVKQPQNRRTKRTQKQSIFPF